MSAHFHKSRSLHPRRLKLEALEARLVMDADALPWGGDAALTLSFAPDGTNVAGNESNLFASLNTVAPTADWQAEILRAFQTWAVETNAAVGLVADGGQPFGTPGANREDPRFGDIRIGAAPLASGTFALAIPADNVLSGTWVGDVIFNSEANLASLADVFAVALHEAGHVFGVGHSADPLSPMHVHGITPMTSLTTADVAALQALHGQPFPDQNELDQDNDSLPDATHLDLHHAGALPEGSAPSVIYGKLSSSADQDYFRLETPGGYSGSLTFTVRTEGISLMMPRLRVLDANGDVLAQDDSAEMGGDSLTLTLSNVTPDRRYYAVVDSERVDAFAVGDYSLVATLDDLNVVPQSTIDQAADGSLRFLPQDEIAKLFGSDDDDDVRYNDDLHTDDDAESGLALISQPGFAPGMRYEAVGSIADASDVDFYVIESPDAGGPVMTIRIRSLEAAGLMPKLVAYDENGQPLSVWVVVNGGGELVAQISGLAGDSEIRLGIGAANAAGLFTTGNYQLNVGFGPSEIVLNTASTGSLTPESPSLSQPLYVAMPQLFHFALGVLPTPGDNQAAVLMRIYNAQEQVVYQVAARPGETRSAASVLLKPGDYRVEFFGLSSSGALDRELNFTLLALPSSDPFVGDPNDPTFAPVYECPDLPGFFCYPGEFISPNPYLWDDFLASQPAPPPLNPAQTMLLLLGDWWTWVWGQMGLNGPPLAQDDKYLQLPPAPGGAVAARLPLNVLNNDLDPENDAFVAVLQSSTTHGELLLLPDGTVDYTPEPGFEGVDTFTYTAYDFASESRVATVRISVGLRGDADGDSDVDGNDFLAWQRNLGSAASPPASGADFDGNALIDAPDLRTWHDNFGIAVPGSAPQAAAAYAAVTAALAPEGAATQPAVTTIPDLRNPFRPASMPAVARSAASMAPRAYDLPMRQPLTPQPVAASELEFQAVDLALSQWSPLQSRAEITQEAIVGLRDLVRAAL